MQLTEFNELASEDHNFIEILLWSQKEKFEKSPSYLWPVLKLWTAFSRVLSETTAIATRSSRAYIT